MTLHYRSDVVPQSVWRIAVMSCQRVFVRRLPPPNRHGEDGMCGKGLVFGPLRYVIAVKLKEIEAFKQAAGRSWLARW